jgi:hypothetical protein
MVATAVQVVVAVLKVALHQLQVELQHQDKVVMAQEVTLLTMLAVLAVQVQLAKAQRLVVLVVTALHLASQELQ